MTTSPDIPEYRESPERKILIPPGYVAVNEGRMYRSDLVANPTTKEWHHPISGPYRPFGCASKWWQVIRKETT